MSEEYLVNYIYIIFYLVCSFATAFIPFLLSYAIRPKITTTEKTFLTYECGMDPFGRAWDFRFGISYYLYALIFLAFDVDILYLFPVATAYDQVSGFRGVTEFFIFVGILSLAIIYAWAKGVFTWEKKKVSC